jgi:hypothetical protein
VSEVNKGQKKRRKELTQAREEGSQRRKVGGGKDECNLRLEWALKRSGKKEIRGGMEQSIEAPK